MSANAFVLRALPLAILFSALNSHAGGLDLPTIAASHQGTSNANSAEAADASVIYYNPAGMAQLRGINVSNSLSVFTIRGKVDVDETGTTRTPPPDANNPGDEGRPIGPSGDAGSFWPKVLGAGSFFATVPLHRINLDALKAIPNYEDITIGIGIFAPGGGNLNYKADWGGRYHADNVAIELININPSVAIRFDDKHSIGFGASVIGGHLRQGVQIDTDVAPYLFKPYVESLNLNQATNLLNGLTGTDAFSNVCAEGLLNSLCSAVGVGLLPLDNQQQSELSGFLAGPLLASDASGKGDVEMYGYGFGYNLGYMFNFDATSRLSLAYRSETTMKMRGDLEWSIDNIKAVTDDITPVLPDCDAGGGTKTVPDFLRNCLRPDTTAKGDLIIPARLSLGYFKALNDKIDLMFDYTFIQTSAVKEIKVKFLDQKSEGGQTVSQGPGGIQTRWRDSFKASVGANYHYNDKLTLKTGFQFDLTPVPSARFRHPGAPDSDRYMFSLGANYKHAKNLTFDAGYSLIILADSRSEYRDPCRGTFSEQEDGTVDFDTARSDDCTGNGGTFRGKFYDTYINMLSFGFNQKF